MNNISEYNVFRLRFIGLIIVFLITNSIAFSQQVNTWTKHVDLTKNGFLETEYLDGYSIIIKQGEPNYAEIYDDRSASQIQKTRNVIIYYKTNGKMILLWGDTRDRVTPYEYDEILQIGVNTFKVQKDQKWGVIDSLGKIIIPVNYSDIEPVDPKLRYRSGSQIYTTDKNLEVQLFYCEDLKWDNSENYLISRKGDTLLKNLAVVNANSIKIVNYFIYGNKIFSVYNKNGKYLIGRFGESPIFEFDGQILWDEDLRFEIDFSNWVVNKLVRPIRVDGKTIFFDFGLLKSIESIPGFDRFHNRIGEKYIQAITNSNISRNTYSINIISNDIKIVAQNLDYLEITEFGCADCYEHRSNDYYNQNQIDLDSLLLFSKKYSLNDDGLYLYGIYKLGVGELIEARYNHISRVNKNICIISDGQGENFLDLRSKKHIYPNYFERINVISGGANSNTRVYECVFEGKVTRVSFPIR